MIFFVPADGHEYTIGPYFQLWGGDVREIVRIAPASEFEKISKVPLAHYILLDVDRYPPAQRKRLFDVWNTIEQQDGSYRLLNHPTLARPRYDLLRLLNERGINSYNVYRLSEHRRPQRYPVYLRNMDHFQDVPELLETPDELERAIEESERVGVLRDAMLIVEYVETRGDDGYRRKYAAHCVDGVVIPRHLLCNRADWFIKVSDRSLDESAVEEEWEYVNENPHEKEVREIFELAHLDYGRIDYGVVDGRLEVWEINPNPVLILPEDRPEEAGPRKRVTRLFSERFNQALRELNGESS